MTHPRNRSGLLSALLTGFVVTGLLTGCASAPAEPEPESFVKAPDALSAEGVVLAAVLLSTADITAAVAEGLVTPAEVDAARAAIEDGTLDEWRVRAEKERSQSD